LTQIVRLSASALDGDRSNSLRNMQTLSSPLRSLAAIDILNINVDTPIEVVFKKSIEARMLKDEFWSKSLTLAIQNSKIN
jgi:hypothetical protein